MIRKIMQNSLQSKKESESQVGREPERRRNKRKIQRHITVS